MQQKMGRVQAQLIQVGTSLKDLDSSLNLKMFKKASFEVSKDGFETHCSPMFTDVLFVLKKRLYCSLSFAVNRGFRCQFCCHTRFTLIFADLDTF
jgi:hypothetical protein